MHIFIEKITHVSFLWSIGLKPGKGCWQKLQIGFLISTGMCILYFAFLYFYGIVTFEIETMSPGSLIGKVFTLIIIAVVVGGVEEFIFRGFILQSILRDTKVLFAVCFCSMFTHCSTSSRRTHSLLRVFNPLLVLL
ncbi:CPBP family glutamic-type intramembrane protease [Candidatus Kuenenia stuttgartensis]|uniref:CPBP family glutamic-type intramembrane protease n=1 Tax=Kuenenia stuttgartiensis TaxID=174633 RepID=UPI003B9697D3